MSFSSIATAFEMLADEFEQCLVETNQRGGAAFVQKDYDAVAGLAERGRRLEEYQKRVAAIEEEWSADPLFNPPATGKKWTKEQAVTPVAFHAQCIAAVQKLLKVTLDKKTRSSYLSRDGGTGVICAVSRTHEHLSAPYYWFSFHPYQSDVLSSAKKGYLVLGCGSSDTILVIPFAHFQPLIKRLNRTERNDAWYSHVRITAESGKLLLHLSGRGERADLTEYWIKG